MFWPILSDSSEANIVHFVEAPVCFTRCLCWISAVILIVCELSLSTYPTTKFVKAIDSDVYDSFRLINKVFANYIAAVTSCLKIIVPISGKLAVSVLYNDRRTL